VVAAVRGVEVDREVRGVAASRAGVAVALEYRLPELLPSLCVAAGEPLLGAATCVLPVGLLALVDGAACGAERQELAAWRRKLYRWLTFGWTGTTEEQHLLEKTISRMAILMIMLAVSVHTVVSWIFAMTLRPGWNSSIFGPYFVMAAVYSGTAAVVLSMYILQRVLHLEDYLKPVHFRNLGLLLVTFSLLYLYFSINEYLTSVYKVEGPERILLHQLFFGDYAVLMWVTQAVFIFIPLLLIAAVLSLKRFRRFTPSVVALASALVVIGAGAKRYLIVVPTLTAPYLPNTDTNIPFDWTHYRPTWVEWSITFGGTALFLIMYMLFTKLFPMVSIWETREDEDKVHLEPAVALVPQPPPQRLGSIPTMTILLVGCILLGSGQVRAEQKHLAKAPDATTLSLEWKQVATAATTNDGDKQQPSADEASGVNRVYGRLFGWLPPEFNDRSQKPPTIVITATLLGAKAQPLPYQVVGLSLKTSFGKLDYGSRPTNPDGKAQFSLEDRRYGQYSVEGTYDGGGKFAAAHAVTSVDFGPRPEPTLPSQGVLIAPYATAWIGLPFLFFFGFVWFVFLYIGVYLLWWRLLQIRKSQVKPS